MKIIKTNNALKVNGHYSQAIVHNDTVYCSGILPFDLESGNFVNGDVEIQCQHVFRNLESILLAAKTSKEKVLKITVYIPDIKLWDKVNEIYGNFFGEYKPCRTIVPTNKLHFDSNIEIDCIAYI